MKAVPPLLCAGITTYSPLSRWRSNVGPGKKVAIVGLGGLGHMGVKLAASFGAEVTVFSTSPSKEQDAKRLGATNFVISTDAEAMKKVAGTFDFILDTVAEDHPIPPLINSLGAHGVLVIVGYYKPITFSVFSIMLGSKVVTSSAIGGIKETQEMLDYCAEKGITADIELINIDQASEAYERVLKNDIKYRFVIDASSIKQQ